MAMLLLVATPVTSGHKADRVNKWLLHEQILRNPPTDRMRDVHMLHHTRSVTMLDENSALRHNMPQHNDEEGGKQPVSFSPAASVWGKMGSAWTSDRYNPPRFTETITVERTMLPSSLSISGSPTILCPRSTRECAMPLQEILHGW
jgi:hypothetical protein